MKRVLLMGISGVGKSTVAQALAAQGYKAIDADTDEWCVWVSVTDLPIAAGTPVEGTRDWVWREDRIEALLSTEDTNVLFVSGTAANMRRFLPQFDHRILLGAPADVIVQRLTTRTNNPYGKQPDEVARVLELKESVEPLLRSVATYEIDTTASLDEIVATVLRLVS